MAKTEQEEPLKMFAATNIDWDIDEDEDGTIPTAKELGLPTNVLIYSKDIEDVADDLSDHYGWCINSLDVEEVA